MALSVYLTFDGECEDAFAHYKSIFGGDYAMMSRFSDGPPDMGVPKEAGNRIMHVSLPVGDSVLMGSDNVKGMSPDLVKGNNFSISYAPKDRNDADRVFAALSVGKPFMEMQETFWGSYFGMCTDKFGVQWMINLDLVRG